MSTRGRDLQVNQATYVKYETNIFLNPRCKVCGKESNRKWHIKNHVEIHFSMNSYMCKLCGVKMKTRNAYMKHKGSKHKNKSL